MARKRLTKIDDPKALGRRLAQLRKERGLSLRALEFDGCSGAYISTIENGRRVPSLQVLHELASRLGVSADYLATGQPSSAEAQLNDAEIALQLGDHEVARERLTELRETLDGRLALRAQAGLGVLELREGNLSEGLELLESARETDVTVFVGLSSAVEELGRCYAGRGEFESAIELFTAARDAAVASSDKPAVLKWTVMLANTYIDLGSLGQSADELAAALAEAAELRDPALRASVLWSQARLHTIEGRHELAAEFGARALETLRVSDDERSVGLAHQMLAYIELERGDNVEAAALLEAGLPLVERSARPSEIAPFRLDLARAYLEVGRDEEARQLLQDVAPVLSSGHLRIDGSRCLVTLGDLYRRLGDEADALAMYDIAIDQLQGQRTPFLAQAHRRKSELLDAMGESEAAFRELKAAVAASELLPNPR